MTRWNYNKAFNILKLEQQTHNVAAKVRQGMANIASLSLS